MVPALLYFVLPKVILNHHKNNLFSVVHMFIIFIDVNLNMAAFGSIDKNHEQMLRVMPPTVPATSQARPAAINSISNE